MEVIPVIDLKGRQVVRAKMGERHLYAPIVTSLAASSAPRAIVAGFLSLAPFRTIYIADLDAIEGQGSHEDILSELQTEFPDLAFWVDPGVKTLEQAKSWLLRNRAHLVLGSESWRDASCIKQIEDQTRIILSLDFRGEAFQGPHRLLDDEQLWPQRLIVMTLARVGSDAGPDLTQLSGIVKRAGSRAVYAAGGLRNTQDLQILKAAGASGVLVASALHDGRLSQDDLNTSPF